ncbi:response regulator transcription factor [Algoriphagus boritolerans]|uniref:DNA-binding response regulator, OmpR family, contains REC and winged-helix (WHTH) domain n=1 Tax=Algoriphagus boritolerans DSM 17298 = JCM 18970 TaxID=1120964 RepID=A0A1H5UEX1_9BACT|nr:response regulator transcription factor [Algoriphagus boritolerans]SEF73605.1 DNA-binding response regulator, OmpR family, contains REC and winged-helix (wHTH) domain [Algoriphagus boritolerans DSM 17298 = JCM 18970]
MNPKILLVEDDKILGYALKTYLEMRHFQVNLQPNGAEGLSAFNSEQFDLCLLDVMMPIMDGFTLAEEIRKLNPAVPVIFLTARSMKIDKLQGFQKGADDYIVKPVDEEELIARIQAVLRRTNPSPVSISSYSIGTLSFDWHSRRLNDGAQTVILTDKEADLLRLLCERKNQLLDRKVVLQELWGKVDYFNRRSMDVHMAKLRKHLQLDPKVTIINIHGKGFILED